MVVRRVLSHVARKLGNFDLILEVSLETREENLALAGFQAVAHAWDGPCAVGYGEEN